MENIFLVLIHIFITTPFIVGWLAAGFAAITNTRLGSYLEHHNNKRWKQLRVFNKHQAKTMYNPVRLLRYVYNNDDTDDQVIRKYKKLGRISGNIAIIGAIAFFFGTLFIVFLALWLSRAV